MTGPRTPGRLDPLARTARAARSHGTWLLPFLAAWAITAQTGGDRILGFACPACWVAATVTGVAVLLAVRARGRRRTPSVAEVLAVEAMGGMLLSLPIMAGSQPLRDLEIYLHAGRHFLDGAPVYTTVPIGAYPADLGLLPFLYPPPTLPAFGLLALLPPPIAGGLWVAGSAVAVTAALRRFGLPWRWIGLLFAWPGLAQGLYVGNVAVPALLLLAWAPPAGWLLVLAVLLKPQSGAMALWLVRERRWRALLAGVAVLGGIVALSVAVTGTDRWREWLSGLDAYAESQRLLPGLYGLGLARYLPGLAVLVAGIAAIAVSLRAAGTTGLGRLAWASAVVSPSLWTHGFLVTIPALLELDATWLWAALALTASVRGPGWALALGLPAVAMAVPALRRHGAATDAALHPLADGASPAWLTGADAGQRPAFASPRRPGGRPARRATAR